MNMQLKRLKAALAGAWLLALLTACVTSPTGRSQFLLISPNAAIEQSQMAYVDTVQALGEEDKLLDDPALARRVAEVTGRIVTVAVARFPHSAGWNWSVALVDEPEVANAWCMAGGRMAVYSGLFEQLGLTDDEFAHIMGHEVVHALANHQAEQISRALATQLGIGAIGALMDKEEGELGNVALAAQLILELPNSRSAEREADQLGSELAVMAGYEPGAAVTLWQKMGADDSGPLEFLSSHPAPNNREATLAARVPELQTLLPPSRPPAHPVRIITNPADLPH